MTATGLEFVLSTNKDVRFKRKTLFFTTLEYVVVVIVSFQNLSVLPILYSRLLIVLWFFS